MNTIIYLMIAARLAAGAFVPATVADLNESDDYTIIYNYSGELREAVVSGYDFNEPPTVGDNLKLYAISATFTDSFRTEAGQIWRYTDDRGEWWNLFPQECKNRQQLRATLIYSDNGTPEQVEDDFLIDFI